MSSVESLQQVHSLSEDPEGVRAVKLWIIICCGYGLHAH